MRSSRAVSGCTFQSVQNLARFDLRDYNLEGEFRLCIHYLEGRDWFFVCPFLPVG